MSRAEQAPWRVPRIFSMSVTAESMSFPLNKQDKVKQDKVKLHTIFHSCLDYNATFDLLWFFRILQDRDFRPLKPCDYLRLKTSDTSDFNAFRSSDNNVEQGLLEFFRGIPADGSGVDPCSGIHGSRASQQLVNGVDSVLAALWS
jgi:hypothetical protein